MKHLVIICPDCGDSMVMQPGHEKLWGGGFHSRCGTVIIFNVDSQLSTEEERIRKLKEGVKNG